MTVGIWHIMLGVNFGFEFLAAGLWVAEKSSLSVLNFGAFMCFFLTCVLFLFFTYPRSST